MELCGGGPQLPGRVARALAPLVRDRAPPAPLAIPALTRGGPLEPPGRSRGGSQSVQGGAVGGREAGARGGGVARESASGALRPFSSAKRLPRRGSARTRSRGQSRAHLHLVRCLLRRGPGPVAGEDPRRRDFWRIGPGPPEPPASPRLSVASGVESRHRDGLVGQLVRGARPAGPARALAPMEPSRGDSCDRLHRRPAGGGAGPILHGQQDSPISPRGGARAGSGYDPAMAAPFPFP